MAEAVVGGRFTELGKLPLEKHEQQKEFELTRHRSMLARQRKERKPTASNSISSSSQVPVSGSSNLAHGPASAKPLPRPTAFQSPCASMNALQSFLTMLLRPFSSSISNDLPHYGELSRAEVLRLLADQGLKDGLYLISRSINFPGDFEVCRIFMKEIKWVSDVDRAHHRLRIYMSERER